MKKKILFIDRDGTLVNEAPPSYQLDSFEKLVFYPHVFEYMHKIATKLDYELVMVTNQDGLGTSSFSETDFWPVHDFIINSFKQEDILFSKVFIDRTFPSENAPTRKPGTAMLTEYLNNKDYDLVNSYVIGDRLTDMELAKNMGCKGIWLNNDEQLGIAEVSASLNKLKKNTIKRSTPEWKTVYKYLRNL